MPHKGAEPYRDPNSRTEGWGKKSPCLTPRTVLVDNRAQNPQISVPYSSFLRNHSYHSSQVDGTWLWKGSETVMWFFDSFLFKLQMKVSLYGKVSNARFNKKKSKQGISHPYLQNIGFNPKRQMYNPIPKPLPERSKEKKSFMDTLDVPHSNSHPQKYPEPENSWLSYSLDCHVSLSP